MKNTYGWVPYHIWLIRHPSIGIFPYCMNKQGITNIINNTDTFSIPTKSLFVNFVEKKNWSKLVLYYPENHQKIRLGLSCAMFTSETNFPPGCRLVMPFSIRVKSCQYELAVIFFRVVYVSTCINIP